MITTVGEALARAGKILAEPLTSETAHDMLSRGNSMEIRIVVRPNQGGTAKLTVYARERLKEWTIFYANDLGPD